VADLLVGGVENPPLGGDETLAVFGPFRARQIGFRGGAHIGRGERDGKSEQADGKEAHVKVLVGGGLERPVRDNAPLCRLR